MEQDDVRRRRSDDDALAEDLARLDPRHWPMVLRRVDALRSYLDMAAPTVADAAKTASNIGVSARRLYQIVRRWRDTGSVAALAFHADCPRAKAAPRDRPSRGRRRG